VQPRDHGVPRRNSAATPTRGVSCRATAQNVGGGPIYNPVGPFAFL
jgi:hypothetical protein